MTEIINIILLNNHNKAIQELNIIKPKTYEKLLIKLKKIFKIYINILQFLYYKIIMK